MKKCRDNEMFKYNIVLSRTTNHSYIGLVNNEIPSLINTEQCMSLIFANDNNAKCN